MELKLDPSKEYAVALEGGGAKGAYQIGAWKALKEAGIRYNAVSGSSLIRGSALYSVSAHIHHLKSRET